MRCTIRPIKTTRYGRRCQARTDHLIGNPPRLVWRWVLFYPLVWLMDRIVDPPTCLLGLGRDDADGDDRPAGGRNRPALVMAGGGSMDPGGGA